MAAYFNIFLIVMALLALAVYIALHYFEAGYGYLFNRKYGFPIPNRIGWVLMECPVFIAMTVLWLLSDRTWEAAPLALLILFQGHYLQRAFIFPLLIRGNSKMPAGIVGMGVLLNTLNALMQGGWIFYISPADYSKAGSPNPIFTSEPRFSSQAWSSTSIPTTSSAICASRAIHAITFPGAVCSATFRRPTISES